VPKIIDASFEVHEFFINDRNPMYVQRWKNANSEAQSTRRSAVLVHGGAHTGVCWTTCPDDRPGWAKLLAASGWTVFVIDWPGVGRSRREDDFLTAGPLPIVEALCALTEQIGQVTIFAHSIGAAIAVKVIERLAHFVDAFVAIAPAPPGNVNAPRPLLPIDRPVHFDADAVDRYFANAENFPHAALGAYRRSLCDVSPSVMNAVACRDGGTDLLIADASIVRSRPSLVVAGDLDQLVPQEISAAVAHFLGADYVLTGKHWGLNGFGHMLPIEIGAHEVLRKIGDWLGCGANC
jgi:pimeloyl-ACP methyl ester carboxylesterase